MLAIYASVRGVLFGALAISYGAISHNAGEQFAGLLLLATGLLAAHLAMVWPFTT